MNQPTNLSKKSLIPSSDDANRQKITIGDLYKIIGNVSKETSDLMLPEEKKKHPAFQSQHSYIYHIEKEISKPEFKENIFVEPMNGLETPIGDMNRGHSSNHKIIIKKMLIDLSSCIVKDGTHSNKTLPYKICLDVLPTNTLSNLSKLECHGSVTIVFEDNHFVAPKFSPIDIEFFLGDGAYLEFNCNKFCFSNMILTTGNRLSMARLTSNTFNNTNLLIKGEQKGVVLLQDNTIPTLTIDRIEYSLKGRNRIDELNTIEDIAPLHWGPYQNIDPKKKNALNHKTKFKGLINHAIKNHDKIQEARLRKELLKCERVLIQEEDFFLSLQDRFILGWSSLVSDYGTSWLRPLLGLFIINVLFATIVVAVFLEPKYSWWFMSTEFKPEFSWYLFFADWSVLFFQFFNPLSSLSEIVNIKGSEWIIAAINVVQKAFLALFLYEIIKIFRRFSK